MLTTEVNDRYTRVGRGTPTGELMRRYWHPIAAVSQMKDRSTKKIRLLGEDLVLYKDRSGTYGLIEPHCAHRRMNLIYGMALLYWQLLSHYSLAGQQLLPQKGL